MINIYPDSGITTLSIGLGNIRARMDTLKMFRNDDFYKKYGLTACIDRSVMIYEDSMAIKKVIVNHGYGIVAMQSENNL